MSKFKTYLGLSNKSRQIVIGQDRIKAYKKSINLLVVCPTASQNLKDLAFRMSEKFCCDLIMTKNTLESETNILNCKFLGITNSSLATAIMNLENEFTVIRRNNGK